jgi:hypothetical protein
MLNVALGSAAVGSITGGVSVEAAGEGSAVMAVMLVAVELHALMASAVNNRSIRLRMRQKSR